MGAPSNVITLTVKCDLDLDEIFGRVHVYTTQDKSMNWVLDEFCREKKVSRVSTFALRSAMGYDYDLTKTIAECSLGEGDLIYCYNKNPPKAKPPPRARQKGSGGMLYGVLALLFLLVALGGIIAIVVLHEFLNRNDRQFTVVVDAGSTSSKIYLYSWPTTLIYNTGKVRQDSFDKTRSLSSSFDHPVNASGPIVRSIKSTILETGLLPSAQVSSTPLYLGATAGMRMLKDRDPKGVAALYKAIRHDLPKELDLKVTDPVNQISIISGTEEGLDAWVTVNYLEGTFGKFLKNMFTRSELPTLGSLDLGGASTQIAFVPNSKDVNRNSSGMNPMRLYGKDYNVYSHSFLCYGKSEAQYRMLAMLVQEEGFNKTTIPNPCYPEGYQISFLAEDFLMVPCSRGRHAVSSYGFEIDVPAKISGNTTFTFLGLGDYKSCEDNVAKLFQKAPCLGGTCSFNGVYQPPINGKFKAFSGFYHVAKFFNATETKYMPKATYYDFDYAVRAYCAEDWKSSSKKYGNSSYTANYCFDGIYVLHLLTGYGFKNGTWDRLQFVETHPSTDAIKDSKVGWSLGFAIKKSGIIRSEALVSISLPLFIGLLVLFCLLFIVAIVLAVMAYRNRKSGRGRFTGGGGEGTGYGSI